MLTRGSHTLAPYLPKLALLAILSALVLLVSKYLGKKTTLTNSTMSDSIPVDALRVYNLLLQAGMNETLAAYATAQSAFETADFTSSVLNRYNNLFGMKNSDLTNYQYYDQIENSVAALVSWYTRHRNNVFSLPLVISSLADYVSFLKNQKYFEADESQYLAGCQVYYNKYFGG